MVKLYSLQDPRKSWVVIESLQVGDTVPSSKIHQDERQKELSIRVALLSWPFEVAVDTGTEPENVAQLKKHRESRKGGHPTLRKFRF
jgi:hypothetical protein